VCGDNKRPLAVFPARTRYYVASAVQTRAVAKGLETPPQPLRALLLEKRRCRYPANLNVLLVNPGSFPGQPTRRLRDGRPLCQFFYASALGGGALNLRGILEVSCQLRSVSLVYCEIGCNSLVCPSRPQALAVVDILNTAPKL
jgi:hypothetical protein